jgi:glycosyltransferase involved in cell wall biosynthesis
MTKVLGLALYGPLAASTRYRLGQYAPGLALRGIELEIHSLLGDDYLRRRFSGRAPDLLPLLQAGLTRFSDLWSQKKFDALMLYCELFPLLPGWMESALLRQPFIYDFDDAFYLKYRQGRFSLVSPLLGCKFDTVIAGAKVVTAGNQLLAQYARKYNPNTSYLPTVVDTERYQPRLPGRSGMFTVGWIGSPSTSIYLSELVRPLSELGKEGPVQFIVIGGKAPVISNVKVLEIGWEERTEISLIQSFDVGVMPMPNDDWARGKCAFKLIQYMACAVPVVASAVGANMDVVTSECGFLASTHEEWLQALRAIRDQPRQSIEMGHGGRDRVVQHYSLQRNLPVLAEMIAQTCKA